MKHTDKGRSVFVGQLISKGEYICEYHGELITSNILKETNHEYNTSGTGSFILEFKFQDKKCTLDATIEDGSFGHLINHSKKFQNVKLRLSNLNGQPSGVFFIATKDISKDEELLFDFGDNSKS